MIKMYSCYFIILAVLGSCLAKTVWN